MQVTSSSFGSIQYSIIGDFYRACEGGLMSTGSGLHVGENGSWSVTLSFSKAVNNVAVVISGADTVTRPEDFIFSTNGGSVSIIPGESCRMNIVGNTITPLPGQAGSGFYLINSTPYTQLTINGGGGSGGSVIGVCSASVLGTQDVKSIQNEMIDPTQVKDILTISSKEPLKFYRIFDESGKLIVSSTIEGNKKDINLLGIMTGSYIIAVETKTQTINKKIVKK
ncbi:T9SS type A sorting domain-containing protein [Chryseobacterium potabilaquae]|uniref:T9SS type A sorting domain-containing protein n=1 Tax=Chryseobacterium potabilaquae TaxID=2675057 RepID=UPI00138A3C23|nr:T9SS type A sorting domain-containing protein [Chryseobacterium potabilaquae]